jgi:hypothetical protein
VLKYAAHPVLATILLVAALLAATGKLVYSLSRNGLKIGLIDGGPNLVTIVAIISLSS